jgi:hypothetical protein
MVAKGADGPDYLFFFPIMLLMGMPGVLAVYFGVKLFREMSEGSLRWVLGIISSALAFWVDMWFAGAFSRSSTRDPLGNLGLALGILVALSAYLLSLRALLPLFGGPKRRALDFVGRGILLILAWESFFLLSSLFDAYSPREPGHQYLRKEPWGIVGFLVPVGVAYGFFRAAQYWLARRNMPLPEAPPAEGEAKLT